MVSYHPDYLVAETGNLEGIHDDDDDDDVDLVALVVC